MEKRREALAGPSDWVDTQKLTARTAQGSEPSDRGPTLPLPLSDHQRKASKSRQ